jgi:hypothetical protein
MSLVVERVQIVGGLRVPPPEQFPEARSARAAVTGKLWKNSTTRSARRRAES